MINNLPTNYTEYPFIIVRMVEGEFWYYGADHDFDRATTVANEVGGIVVIRWSQFGRREKVNRIVIKLYLIL